MAIIINIAGRLQEWEERNDYSPPLTTKEKVNMMADVLQQLTEELYIDPERVVDNEFFLDILPGIICWLESSHVDIPQGLLDFYHEHYDEDDNRLD